MRNIHLATLKIDLRNAIKEMRIQDQFYRTQDYEGNIAEQNKIDSINAKKIIKIFNDFGYPNENIIGEFNIDNSFVDIVTILLHTKDSERLDYFMPEILNFIKKGTASPKTYASMKDQYNLYHGNEQYYGSYENKTSINLNELNRRRKIIGLPNYGYEKWRFKQLYPNEEY
ncbi:MAG: hypothetical protein V4548_06685 [Bacteroidota bacterium]